MTPVIVLNGDKLGQRRKSWSALLIFSIQRDVEYTVRKQIPLMRSKQINALVVSVVPRW